MSARDLPLSQMLALAAGPVSRVDPQARVEGGVTMGDGCVVRYGAYLPRGTRLDDDVSVGANATFVEAEYGEAGTVVHAGARIGAGAVVHAGLRIGTGACVRPGAVVTCDVLPGATVAGNPAVVVGMAAATLDQAGFPA